MSQPTTHLFLDEVALTILPTHPEIEKALTYVERTLEQDEAKPWKGTKVRQRKAQAYEDDCSERAVERICQFFSDAQISRKEFGRGIETHQGAWRIVTDKLRELGMSFKLHDLRLPFPKPRLDLIHGLRFGQEPLLKKFLSQNISGILEAPTRYGKCFGHGTLIRMYDGSSKAVENVQDGMLVMGPDSKPRRVTGVTSGLDEMFRIVPKQGGGEPWECNSAHILHLVRTNDGTIMGRDGATVNIELSDYIGRSRTFKHVHKMLRAPVNWAHKNVPIDPYVYGLWLGDGHATGAHFTNAEPEVWEALDAWATKEGLVRGDDIPAGGAVTRHYVTNLGTGATKRGTAHHSRSFFRDNLKADGIQPIYMQNSREVQMEVLAGFVDSDGEVNNCKCYAITSKHKKLAEDLVRMCLDLGFDAKMRPCQKSIKSRGFVGHYFRVYINGPVDQIPVRVLRKRVNRKNKFNCLRYGFSVQPLGIGRYFGFCVDGPDNLFLLADNTIVHNTHLIANTLRAYSGLTTVVTAPGADLVRQLYEDLKPMMVGREVKVIGSGIKGSAKFSGDDITVCSMDSLHKCDFGKVELLLVDEIQSAVTDERMGDIVQFHKARRLGFSATTGGRFDGRDILIETLIGPTLARRTFREGVEEGAICDIVVIMIHVGIPHPGFQHMRHKAYASVLHESPIIASLTSTILGSIIPPDWQTIAFIKTEKSAEFFREFIPDAEIAMAKVFDNKAARVEMMRRMASGELKRCLASDIYSQGVTFSDLRVMVNLAGGGPYFGSVQKPGRLAQVRPGKKAGIMFDFVLEPQHNQQSWDPRSAGEHLTSILNQSAKRLEVYQSRGYQIHHVRTPRELKEALAPFV